MFYDEETLVVDKILADFNKMKYVRNLKENYFSYEYFVDYLT